MHVLGFIQTIQPNLLLMIALSQKNGRGEKKHMQQNTPSKIKALLTIRELGLCDYEQTWQRMIALTDTRTENTPDELWLLEHPPVFTQGLAGKAEHVLNPGDIPVIQADRGGQVTYHGPGQLVAYLLFDLRRLHIGIRQMVRSLEQSIVDLLAEYAITANGRCDAPGVYVSDTKICSIGLRVRKGCSYHGIALNVAMDLTPFSRINPCGFKQLQMAQIKQWVPTITVQDVMPLLVKHIHRNFGYNLLPHIPHCE
jgi:lipoyl(octanoyl) transferase